MKPTQKRFKTVAEKCGGNVSAMAKVFGVYRTTIYDWASSDEEFGKIIKEHRGRLLDRCLKTADLLANGVPEIEMTEGGPTFVGWKVPPDSGMLRYLISTLGRNEGFGESVDITSKGESIKPEQITVEVIDRREQVDREDTN